MDPFLDNPTKITMSSAPADLVIERVDDMVNDFDLEDAEDIRDFLARAGFDPYWTTGNTIKLGELYTKDFAGDHTDEVLRELAGYVSPGVVEVTDASNLVRLTYLFDGKGAVTRHEEVLV